MKSTRAQSALSVGVLQSFRAVLIGFIPIALITLVAWAAGGSGNGKSADAIHGAGWIWLAAHHVGFNLRMPPGDVAGSLWLLPLGLSVIPWFVLRDSGKRIAASVNLTERRLALFAFAATYALSLVVGAKALTTTAVSPDTWVALPIGFFFAFFSGASGIYGIRNLASALTNKVSALARSLIRGIAATSIFLYGASVFILIGAVIAHWSRFSSLFTVLDPGWIGLLLLSILILASLPNAVVMVVAIATGAGIAMGSHTLISPWRVSLRELPAFPLLAALPAGRSLALTLLPIITILASAIGSFLAVKSVLGLSAKLRGAVLHAVANTIILLLLSLLAGGSLIGGQLGAIGASYWRILAFGLPMMMFGSIIGGLVSSIGSKSEVSISEH